MDREKKITSVVSYEKQSHGLSLLAAPSPPGSSSRARAHRGWELHVWPRSCVHLPLPPAAGKSQKARNDLRDGLGGQAGGSSAACAYARVGLEITVQINSETERRMWDVLNLPPFKSAAEESQQNFINKT